MVNKRKYFIDMFIIVFIIGPMLFFLFWFCSIETKSYQSNIKHYYKEASINIKKHL